jgi:hypothetical protein
LDIIKIAIKTKIRVKVCRSKEAQFNVKLKTPKYSSPEKTYLLKKSLEKKSIFHESIPKNNKEYSALVQNLFLKRIAIPAIRGVWSHNQKK